MRFRVENFYDFSDVAVETGSVLKIRSKFFLVGKKMEPHEMNVPNALCGLGVGSSFIRFSFHTPNSTTTLARPGNDF